MVTFVATAEPDIIGPNAPAASVAMAIPVRNCAVVRLLSRLLCILVSLQCDKDRPTGAPGDNLTRIGREVAMKALVDRLSAELSDRYIQYLETFMVDLWSDSGLIEFRAGYSLRCDHQLRSFTVKVEADSGQTDAERELLIIVVFDEIEEQIDLAIAGNRVAAN